MGAQLCKQICNRQGESGDALGRRVLSEMVGRTVLEKSSGRVAKLIDTDSSSTPCKLCYFDSVGKITWLPESDVTFLAVAEKCAFSELVGRAVLEKSTGRLAKLIATDSSDEPCKICYFDGVGDVCWLSEREIHVLTAAEEKELLQRVTAADERYLRLLGEAQQRSQQAAEAAAEGERRVAEAQQLREAALKLQRREPAKAPRSSPEELANAVDVLAAIGSRLQASALQPKAPADELPVINSRQDLETLFGELQQAAQAIESTPPAEKAAGWSSIGQLWAHALKFSQTFELPSKPPEAVAVELPVITGRQDLEQLFRQLQKAARAIETTAPADKAAAWSMVEQLWAHALKFSAALELPAPAVSPEARKESSKPDASAAPVTPVKTKSDISNMSDTNSSANLQVEYKDGMVGHTIRVKATGQVGKVITQDASELPYKVRFSENDANWFKAEDVQLILNVGSPVKVEEKGIGLIVGKEDASDGSPVKVQLRTGGEDWFDQKSLSPVTASMRSAENPVMGA